MAGVLQNLWNGIAPRYKTDEERQAEALAERSENVWGDILTGAPSTNDMMGLDAFAGQMPPEFIEQYFRENSNLSPEMAEQLIAQGGLDNLTDRQQQEIRAAYVQQQVDADPFFGLQQLGDPETGATAADPDSIAAQRRALQQMGGIYDAGGYTNAERAQMQMAQRDAAMGERSQRLALQQQAAARGMGGGGMEMMGALAAQQGGANRANDWANQIAVAGQQRALQALQNYGQQASQMRGQSFDEDARRRSARDAWTAANVSAQNNWTAQRGQAAQTGFNNQLAAAAGATDQFNGQAADLQNQSAANTAQAMQTTQAAISALGTAFGGPAGGAAASTGYNYLAR